MTGFWTDPPKALLLRLINLGVDELSATSAERVRLTNAVSITITAVAAVFVLQYVLITPHLAAGLLQAGFALLHGLALVWTAAGRIELARLWVCAVYLLDVSCFAAVVLPPETGASLFLVLAPVFALVIYEPARHGPKYAVTAVTVAAYAAVLGGNWGAPWLTMPARDAIITNVFTFASCVFGLMVGTHIVTFDRQHTEGALSELAATDHLTGVYNRRAMAERGERLIHAAADTGQPLSLIMLDIDRFKPINDRYGHRLGDRVLRDVAAALVSSVRRSDLVGRYGGEEFVVILPNTPVEDARIIAESLRRTVAAQTTNLDGRVVRCTVSLGVAGLDAGATSLEALTEQADRALYSAKAGGRDRIAVTPAAAA